MVGERCTLEINGEGLDLSGIIKQFKNLHKTDIKIVVTLDQIEDRRVGETTQLT